MVAENELLSDHDRSSAVLLPEELPQTSYKKSRGAFYLELAIPMRKVILFHVMLIVVVNEVHFFLGRSLRTKRQFPQYLFSYITQKVLCY